MDHIYTLTTLINPTSAPGFEKRVHAWYPTEQLAIEAAENDWGSMCECRYDYLVIEKVPVGPLPESENIKWFKWEHPSWQELKDCPDIFRGICNFSI